MSIKTSGIRAAIAALSLSLAASGAEAADFGLSASGSSFISGDYAAAGLRPGLFARGEALVGLGPLLELSLCGIAEATPSPLRGAFLGAEASLPLFGSREKSYFNMFLSLGFLQAFDCYEGSVGARYLTLRLTPISIGTPFYGRRDRAFSVGALYELESRELAFTWSVLSFDWFPGRER